MKNFVRAGILCFKPAEGSTGLALAYLLDQDGLLGAASNSCATNSPVPSPLTARKPQFPPRATPVISMFMSGGVSHMDTFDPKPALSKYPGKPLEGKGDIIVRQGNPGPLMPSPFSFKKYGQSGMDVSEIFPTYRH